MICATRSTPSSCRPTRCCAPRTFELYNLDTLKFCEALIALQRGGVLGALRADGPRRVVVEVGSGWGGFAYQLKTLCPQLTIVLVDLPELFLFSGTYLRTLFPEDPKSTRLNSSSANIS